MANIILSNSYEAFYVMSHLFTKDSIPKSVVPYQLYTNSLVFITTLSHYMQVKINPNNASLHARSPTNLMYSRGSLHFVSEFVILRRLINPLSCVLTNTYTYTVIVYFTYCITSGALRTTSPYMLAICTPSLS